MAKAALNEDLRRILEPVVAEAGLDLEAIELTPAGKRRLLRVIVDRDGGVGLDAVASVSQLVSAALDSNDPLGGAPYVLEVTSPGVDRPLTQRRHWERAAGRLVQTRIDGRELVGRVRGVTDDGVDFDTDGTPHFASWAALEAGHVQIEFKPRGVRDGSGEEA